MPKAGERRRAETKKKEKRSRGQISFQNDFYSDISMEGMLYARTVRSPVPAGIITSISQGDLPDGYFLFTAHDVPGCNLIQTALGKVPVFSEGNIAYCGEPVGILVGPDEKELDRLLQELQINYDANTIESYLEPSAPAEEESDRNSAAAAGPDGDKTEKVSASSLFSSKIAERKIERGECFQPDQNGIVPGLEAVFASAATVQEGTWSYAVNTPYYREPNGALCSYDGEQLTVYTPTQWLSNLRKVLSEATGIDGANIIVNKTRAYDRGTNSIWYNAFIACQAAVASYRTGHPVKLVYTRYEQETYMDCMQPITISHKTALSREGKLLALQANIEVNAGSSNVFIREIIDRLAIAACGCYDAENVSITSSAFYSRNPPSSIDQQLIDSAAFFAIENQINSLCSKSGFTPAELRLLNLTTGDITARNAPLVILPQAKKTVDAIIARSDFNRKYASYHLDNIMRTQQKGRETQIISYLTPLRGIGFACGYEGSCYYGSEVFSSDQSLAVTMQADGTIVIQSPPISRSIQEIWSKLASTILGITQSSVSIDSNFDADNEPLLPEGVYSNISIMTLLLKKCCESLKKRKPDTKLPYTVKKKLSSTQKRAWDSANFEGTPFHSCSFAAATIEVELDPCTFREKVREINIIINGGKILNSTAAESNIKLAVQRVLTSLVEEDTIECSSIKIAFMQSEENPTQIGELVYQVLPAAYTEALSQALGCTVSTLPLQSNSLYKLLQAKESEELQQAKKQKAAKDEAAKDLPVTKEVQPEQAASDTAAAHDVTAAQDVPVSNDFTAAEEAQQNDNSGNA